MFLTPDGKPIVGGTYWPREDARSTARRSRLQDDPRDRHHDARQGEAARSSRSRPTEVADAHDADAWRHRVASLLVDARPRAGRRGRRGAQERVRPASTAASATPKREVPGPEVPDAAVAGIAAAARRRTKDDELLEHGHADARPDGRGGIYDQLGGGFHRYSTERTWTVPHFEKMLYDNAQLVELYSRAFAATQEPAVTGESSQETLAFVRRELTPPEGGFYSRSTPTPRARKASSTSGPPRS